MEKFWTGLKLHLRYSTVPGYGLATMVTAGGERILFTVAFQCPCSLVFLLVPALALFLLCYVLSVRAWRLVTGCCELWSRAKVWTHLTWAGMLASLTWVAVALLGDAFYECGASGSTEVARRLCAGRDSSCAARLPLVPCQQAGEPDVQDLLRELRAQSQVLGWCVIAAVIIAPLIFVCVSRCLATGSFLQLQFLKTYSEQEQEILKRQTTELATKLAEENVKCFFESSHPETYDAPSAKDWQQISLPRTFKPNEQDYSVLHKYVKTKAKKHFLSSSERDEVVSSLSVDSPDMVTTAEL